MCSIRFQARAAVAQACWQGIMATTRVLVANLGLNSGHHTDSYTNHKPTGFGCVSVQEILQGYLSPALA